MAVLKKYISNLYFTSHFFIVGSGVAFLFLLSYFFPLLFPVAFICLLAFCTLFLVEYLMLFAPGHPLIMGRQHAQRLSNGDENEIRIIIGNRYPFTVNLEIIDEVPYQFQYRNVHFRVKLGKHTDTDIRYTLRPVKRGVYSFGDLNAFASCLGRMLQRRIKSAAAGEVAVYPAYLQLRHYQILAMSNRLHESGQKRQVKKGQSLEFDQIKEYVRGDDYRQLNWNASARKGTLMVNQFVDEKSQPIYCIIDKGRLMEMPFRGMSLLDYAINASLILSNVALLKDDKAGLITFSEKNGTLLPADRRPGQMQRIQEILYRQKSRFLDSDFEKLYIRIQKQINQRSLLLMFTNFNSLNGMRRQLPYLRHISKRHLLVVILFENTEIRQVEEQTNESVKDIYIQTVALQFGFEKRQIIKELKQNGILAILSAPEKLTVDSLNAYLNIKNRRIL